ncbi:DMT family transporter [Shimia biformata]|uniref:DMT family transporter n=1 Tax=Shimia biformata TaxID=1294299 RepID=UPI001951A98F|nr:DMT family transporter [Shimia biformata]
MWAAVAIMFIAMSLIPAGDTAGKLLTTVHGTEPVFVAWSRFLLGSLLAAPFAARGTRHLFTDWRLWFRGFLMACGISSIQYALQAAPIANVFAAFFIGPIFSFVLSVVFLKERVTPVRSILMFLGFVGVLMVVRPGIDITPGLGYAVMAGLFYGAFLTSSRWMSATVNPKGLLFTQLVTCSLILTPFALLQLPNITAQIGGLTVASAAFSMLGNFLLLVAYSRAEASRLAPMVYFQLIAAVGLGWLVFLDLPDTMTLFGLVFIIGSGVASALAGARKGSVR